MKDNKRSHVVCSLAILTLAPVGITRAQSPNPSPEVPAEATNQIFLGQIVDDGAAFFINPESDNVRGILEEMEKLDAATARKRDELQMRLAQAQAEQERNRKEALRRREGGAGSRQPAPDPFYGALGVAEQRRWLIGVQVSPTSKDGVEIASVMSGLPAAEAGLMTGDVIESVNDIRVRDVSSLNAIINAAGDQKLSFSIRRAGERLKAQIKPARQEAPKATGIPDPFSGGQQPGFGVFPRNEPQLRRYNVAPNTLRGGSYQGGGGDRNPNSAEIDALKREIVELRELVEGLATSIAGTAGEDEGETEEGDGDDADPEVGVDAATDGASADPFD